MEVTRSFSKELKQAGHLHFKRQYLQHILCGDENRHMTLACLGTYSRGGENELQWGFSS